MTRSMSRFEDHDPHPSIRMPMSPWNNSVSNGRNVNKKTAQGSSQSHQSNRAGNTGHFSNTQRTNRRPTRREFILEQFLSWTDLDNYDGPELTYAELLDVLQVPASMMIKQEARAERLKREEEARSGSHENDMTAEQQLHQISTLVLSVMSRTLGRQALADVTNICNSPTNKNGIISEGLLLSACNDLLQDVNLYIQTQQRKAAQRARRMTQQDSNEW